MLQIGLGEMEGLYYKILKIWRFFLFLPITIASVIFGIYYRKKNYKVKKNIIIGIIFSFLLIVFGSMYFVGLNNYSRDIGYLKKIENTVDFTFPSRTDILTFKWTIEPPLYDNDNYYKYISIVRFKDEEEISEFINRMSTSTKWKDNLSSSFKNFIPINFYLETKDYDYFMIYCIEKEEYNEVYSESNLNYIYMAYNINDKVLIITEFGKK